MSGPVDHYFQPLCPLMRADDEARYLAVDSSLECFNEFKAAFADPERWKSQGHLVVVTGDRGYGKTSLVQRCAHWLREQARSHGAVVVVDLSDERWGEKVTEEMRLKRTLSWILDALRDTLEKDELEQIAQHSELADSFRDLGRVLGSRLDSQGAAQPVLLIVLLQGYPRPAEIEQYYQLARPGMFFFAELFEREEIAKVTTMMPDFNRVTTGVHHLALSVLKSGDADLLVDWIRHNGGSWPEIPKVVRDHFNNTITGYKVGIRELGKLAWGTLAVAAAEAAHRVTVIHIAKYYAQDKYERNV